MKHSILFKIFWGVCFFLLCAAYAHSKPVCTVTRYDENSGLSQWRVTQMVQGYNDLIWFATWNGLNRFDGYEFKCFKVSQAPNCRITDDRIRNIWLSDEGNIYCKTDEGYYLFNTTTNTFHDIEDKSEEELYNKLLTEYKGFWIDNLDNGHLHHTDGNGYKWVITHSGEMYYESKRTGKLVPYQLDVPMEDLRFGYSDRQGNLWILFTGGVYKFTFSDNSIEYLPQDHPTHVRCVFVDSWRRYWVTGRDDASVRIFNADHTLQGYLGADGRIHRHFTPFDAPIYCITQSSTGTIWMGSKPGGLYRLDAQDENRFEITHYTHNPEDPYSLSHNDIYDISEDNHSRLWIATLGGGINCMPRPHEEGKFIHLGNHLKGYPQGFCKKVREIYLNPTRTILMAATNEGLIVTRLPQGNDYEEMVFHHHVKLPDDPTSLSCRAIMDILCDSHGNIFISTENGGINQLMGDNLLADTLKFKHFDATNGLPSDVTLRMAEYEGSLWVICANQICVINPYEEMISNFDANFFQRNLRFSEAKPVRLADDKWIFGLHDGAFTLSTDKLRKSEYVPPVILTGISTFGEEKQAIIPQNNVLTLAPHQRNVMINYAAIDYTNASLIEYAFRLSNDDTQGSWHKAGKGRSATFFDMKPGKYVLEISSTNADGVWVDNILTLTIHVEPTFWETGWATLLWIVVALAIAALIGYTYIYIRQINLKQKETLEAYLALLAQAEQTSTETLQQPAVSQPALNDEDSLFMKKVMAFVEEHIADADININDMASATATSRSGLNRKMKSLLGVTPLDFLREARIKRACQMLAESDLNVSEIAFKCGFSDPKYFSRCFKASTGKSPTEYKHSDKRILG